MITEYPQLFPADSPRKYFLPIVREKKIARDHAVPRTKRPAPVGEGRQHHRDQRLRRTPPAGRSTTPAVRRPICAPPNLRGSDKRASSARYENRAPGQGKDLLARA
jgi:hypothetical protein